MNTNPFVFWLILADLDQSQLSQIPPDGIVRLLRVLSSVGCRVLESVTDSDAVLYFGLAGPTALASLLKSARTLCPLQSDPLLS